MSKGLIVSLIGLLTFMPFNTEGSEEMTPKKMTSIIKEFAEKVKTESRLIQFTYNSVRMNLIYDKQHDRMRVVSPIIKVSKLSDGQLKQCMRANYHDALDARYAISEGIVWSTFIHPLSDLTVEYLKSAIKQVAMAKLTFGEGYSSGALQFGSDN